MGLMTNDIGKLFAVMQSNYGNRWVLGPEAMGIWREKLKQYDAELVMKAASAAIDHYLDWPPTIGQFAQICFNQLPRSRNSGYLPAPDTPVHKRMANRLMYIVLKNAGGVDKSTLKEMIAEKERICGALDREPDDAFLKELEDELTALANFCNKEQRAIETEVGRKAFCVRQGVKA